MTPKEAAEKIVQGYWHAIRDSESFYPIAVPIIQQCVDDATAELRDELELLQIAFKGTRKGQDKCETEGPGDWCPTCHKMIRHGECDVATNVGGWSCPDCGSHARWIPRGEAAEAAKEAKDG